MTPAHRIRRTPPGQRRFWSRFRVGLLALALVVLATYLGFAKDLPFTDGYRVHAVFESSNNLRPGSPVRIAGVNVGEVVDVGRYEDTSLARVTMEIEDEGLPIHRDATLKIRPRIFLEGNFFVDVRPGSPSSPEVPDGGTIGPTQTSTPVQLDEVLSSLQGDSREDLQRVLQELGTALNSKPTPEEDADQDPAVRGLTGGEALNRSYDHAPQALRGTALVNSALLGTAPHDLSRMISGVAALSKALERRQGELQSLVGTFNTTAGSFAAQSASLQASIRLLGPTLTEAREAFRSLDRAFPSTRAFAREILPGVRETPETIAAAFPWIRQTRALLRPQELRGLLAELQPAVEDLADLTDASLTFLPQLDLADRCFARVIIPAGNIGVEDGPLTTRRPDGSIVENYKEFWYAMVGLAGEGQNFDGNGHYIRFALGGGAHTVKAGLARSTGSTVLGNANFEPLGTSPLFPAEDPPIRTEPPCYRAELPDVNGPRSGPGAKPESTAVPTPPPFTPKPTATAGASSAEATP